MTADTTNFKFLLNVESRKMIRTFVLVVYFFLFQTLILLQKPFLQVEFIFSFYAAFVALFVHHLYLQFFNPENRSSLISLSSYAFDFMIIILFMRSFPQLSSFLLVIQLFLLFLASFDLAFVHLCGLGFMASFGISIMNLSVLQTGSIQNILSLALFNLSYLAVIIVSGQLKNEIYGIQKDLSLAQRKSKSQAEFSKVLLEKIPLGLVVSQNNFDILMQNDFVQHSLRLEKSDVQNIIKNSDESRQSRDVFFESSEAQTGKRVFQLDKVNYFDAEINDNLTISLIKDVTEIRNLEVQLKQKDKLAAIGQLAAGIAHEIRNPLAGISGSVQMLSSEALDPDQLKLMKIILKEIDRLNNLITEFLDYAKPEKKPSETVELSLLLEEVIQNIKSNPIFFKTTMWNVELKKMKVLGFADKLKQAFLNIIINALQATDSNTEAKIVITMTMQEKHCCISIKDHGQGMNPETKNRLFEPFYTTKSKGTGLGLAMTHKILESHEAQVIVNSELGFGTEFIIKFPSWGH